VTGFVVDDAQPGTAESAWRAAGRLGALPTLALPSVDAAVVVAPHPDDEILAAGGLMQILAAAGVAVEVFAVTDGEAACPGDPSLAVTRNREAERALRRLGAPAAFRRDRVALPDGGVAAGAGRLAARLTDRLRPDVLCVAPWRGDRHPDHEAAGEVAAAAAHAAGSPLIEYPVWAWHWADPGGEDFPWSRAHRLPLTPRQAVRKRWALAAHRSQLRPGPGGEPPIVPRGVAAHFRRRFEVFFR
jgi:LmbE family N-acetylglucosaminyl deacetylase